MTMFFAKKLNKKGFTLAELLIVVAIIAVLVAIAIPIFTGALEKARYGVHKSNARSLKSMAVADILASAGFEQYGADKKTYEVVGWYNFTTETFTISSITASKDTTKQGKMFANKDGGNTWNDFDISAGVDAIGKISTAKGQTAYYKVIVSSADLKQVEPTWG